MAKPFTLDLLPGAAEKLPRSPGWHKRALAAERRHKPTTAPQKGDPRADAKAVDYARWLAARDRIEIPADAAETRVDWQPTQHGYRPRAVTWHPAPRRYHPAARGMAQPAAEPLLRIDLPHWDYEAPAVVEVTLLEWAAPVVTEVPAEPAAAPVQPAEAPHIEPMALCPAVGLPCKLDCGFRSGCVAPAPVVAMTMPVFAASEAVEETDMLDAEPLAPLCSDDDVPAAFTKAAPEYACGDAPAPVTVLCLSHKAREAVVRRTDGRAVPDHGHGAKGGAFRISLDDARACAGIRSVRFVGLPRKPYTRAAAPAQAAPAPMRAPREAIAGLPSLRGMLAAVAPASWPHPLVAGWPRPPVVLHAAPTL